MALERLSVKYPKTMIALAKVAGTAIRIGRAPVRAFPAMAGAAAISVCTGEFVTHVFHHGLAPWVAGLLAGCFAMWFGAELNRTPPPVRQDDTGL